MTELFLFLAGIILFAWFIHREGTGFYLALAGLLLVAVSIVNAVLRSPSVWSVFGLDNYDRNFLAWSLTGLIAGLVASAAYRYYARWPLMPGSLTIVAMISPLIGMTEELVFRGYLQGRIRAMGPYFAVLAAALAHTGYKFLVMKSLGPEIMIDLSRLVFFTFVFGLIASTIREYSRNVIPAILSHVIFDILVYGDFNFVPAWVWG